MVSTGHDLELDCTPLTAAIGACVEGVDLRAEPSASFGAALQSALARHHVLFFRGQGLDDQAHRRLAECLGPVFVHPFEAAMGRSEPVHGIVDRPEDVPDRAGWHTDDSYLEHPPAYAVLRCEVAPEAGGDTAWCNMEAAFDGLSGRMRDFLAGLRGVHATEGSLLDYVRTHLPPDRVAETLARVGSGSAHPIVRTHPVSGKRALYFELNFMRQIEGLSDAESRFVRAFLARQVENVSLQCRFHWRPGDVAIWDERSTQHIGAADHAGQRRVMRRCLVAGERPV